MRARSERTKFWTEHYSKKHQIADSGSAQRLEYSNDRVQAQIYAHVLDGVGSLAGRRVLDAGCGMGCLSLCMHAIGAKVLALDSVAGTIQSLKKTYPFIDWETEDLHDKDALATLGEFDVVTSVEVLQYVDFKSVVRSLWSQVAHGGRLVFSVPNSRCPIVQRVQQREGPFWQPLEWAEIKKLGVRLPNLHTIKVKTLSFRKNQDVSPYRASDWAAEVRGTPNRLIVMMQRIG